MKLAASFLGVKNPVKVIKELNDSKIDFFHYDIMDGIFVKNKTRDFKEDLVLKKIMKKPFDVHLMVKDVRNYVDLYKTLNPLWITFHLEIGETKELINYVKNQNIEVGLSLNPNTSIEKLIPFLKEIDVVLVMSVEAGLGGQKFLNKVIDRIAYLHNYRKNHGLSFLIQVDGGINNKTIKKCQLADIAVVGSYITSSSNYNEQITFLRK